MHKAMLFLESLQCYQIEIGNCYERVPSVFPFSRGTYWNTLVSVKSPPLAVEERSLKHQTKERFFFLFLICGEVVPKDH